MPRLLVVALTLLLLAACSQDPAPGLDASVALPEDAQVPADVGLADLDAGVDPGDASVEGGDAEVPPDAAAVYDAGPKCTAQAQCGDPVQDLVANLCLEEHCRLPGQVGADGKLETLDVTFESLYASSFSQPGNRPATQVTRLIWGKHVDGTPVTCADVKARSGAVEADRSKLDLDPAINQSYRGLYVLVWGGTSAGQTRFPILTNGVPRGVFIVYAEAWYGPRDGQNPTGQRASVVCKENIDLTTIAASPTPQIRLDFNP